MTPAFLKLRSYGAQLEIRDRKGYTPLIYASVWGPCALLSQFNVIALHCSVQRCRWTIYQVLPGKGREVEGAG